MTKQEKFEELRSRMIEIAQEANNEGFAFVSCLEFPVSKGNHVFTQQYTGDPAPILLALYALERAVSSSLENIIDDQSHDTGKI